ncbi:substrate-binding domain-containing protein [Desulfovibrio sp. JC010]|uniref:substrate-binding domain-containing protein n=1 Tax=Desulfovibrio sp. JC010 TaxID=2593641 RepID=UPI0013D6860C|nr:substrate-binding domain-containing protein [Desulfovibrio sp. JC010]NDV27457.1 substrate-binding domain-containing protein [Desulfovibrio sp. JC010]
MKINPLLPLIIILTSLLLALPAEAGKYFTLDEYITAHPQEKIREDNFRKIVKNNAVRKARQIPNPKIAIIYPSGQISDYWRRSIKSFTNRLKHYGLEPIIVKFPIKPSETPAKHASTFRKAVQANPDYLIFTLDALRHQRMIESALVAGHPKIILQNITTPLKEWEDKQPFMYVGFDHATGAKILAQYFADKTGGNGKYAILLPDPGYLNEARGKTFISYMDEKTSLKLVSLFQTGINKEKARLATINIAEKHPEIKFIYACSTDIALGAIEGLRETGQLGKIMVNGWGGGSPEIEAIQKGELDVTLMRINDDNGVAMADAIILDILEKKSQIPLVFSGRFEILEKGVSPERLQLLQRESFRYSGSQKDN